MRLLIEVNLKKVDGKTCDEDDVFLAVEELLDGETLYAQNPEADDETSYEVTSVIFKPRQAAASHTDLSTTEKYIGEGT